MDKSRIIFLGLAATLGVSGQAEAQTPGGFTLGLEAFDYSYRERNEGQTVAFDDGKFAGAHLDYVETIGSGLFLRSRLALSWGSVDYRSENGTIDNVSQDIGQLELQIGRDFVVRETTVTPFVGLASRILKDRSGGREAQDGAQGYDREIAYSYVPAGVAARVALPGRNALTFSGQYNWVVGGYAKSEFSKLDPELPDVKVDLAGGHGFEASAALELPLGRRALSFGPFVRHWNVDASERFRIENPDDPSEAIELFEPRNRTTELGVRVSFRF